MCDNIESLRTAVTLLDDTFCKWALTISTKNTKVLIVGRNAESLAAHADINIWRDRLEVVPSFKYLGCLFTSDCIIDSEIANRIASASAAFAHLRKVKVWSSKALSLTTKLQLFQAIVMSVLLYGAETWTLLNKHCATLSLFLMSCLRLESGCEHISHMSRN